MFFVVIFVGNVVANFVADLAADFVADFVADLVADVVSDFVRRGDVVALSVRRAMRTLLVCCCRSGFVRSSLSCFSSSRVVARRHRSVVGVFD